MVSGFNRAGSDAEWAKGAFAAGAGEAAGVGMGEPGKPLSLEPGGGVAAMEAARDGKAPAGGEVAALSRWSSDANSVGVDDDCERLGTPAIVALDAAVAKVGAGLSGVVMALDMPLALESGEPDEPDVRRGLV